MSSIKNLRSQNVLLNMLLFFLVETLFEWKQWVRAPGNLLVYVSSAVTFGLVNLCFQWWQFQEATAEDLATLVG